MKPLQTIIAALLFIAALLIAVAGTGFLAGVLWHTWQIGFRAGLRLL